MAKTVITIPATCSLYQSKGPAKNTSRRDAAYASVSTEIEEQSSSYENQINYYISHI